MKRFVGKVMMLAVVLCLLFAVSASAATMGGTTQQVETADELYALINDINAEGMAAYLADRGSRMQQVKIELMNDITLTKRVEFKQGTNVHLYSTAGKQYTIKTFKLSGMAAIVGDTTFSIVGTGCFKLSNVIVDGDGKNSGFLKLAGSEAVLENITVRNFDIQGITLPMYSLISADSTNANAIQGAGGETYYVAPKITVANSQFLDNKSPNGGAMFATEAEIEIENSIFKNNTAVQYGSAGQKKGEGGGALHLKQSTATITNTRFIGNKSEISGGAVQAFYNTDVDFTDCTFEDNEAVTHGGAICVCDNFDNDNPQSSVITLTNCTLVSNKANGNDADDNFASSPEAAGGGAIFLHEYCDAYLNEGTVLAENESADEGGAVYVSFGARLFMNGAQIESNKAATNGGGVYIDGTDAYSGYPHNDAEKHDIPKYDDGHAAGGKLFMTDGSISRNIAGKNGGGVYIGGENEVEVDGEVLRFVGGEMLMSGGVITENQAMDMGGGIYVGSSGNEDIGGIFDMVGGTVHENIAGQDGNTSTGLDDAGAEIFSEGYTSYISVVSADEITAYIRDRSNRFVPESHRSLYYEDWYDDYSDQDPEYGKAAVKVGTGVNTGRYESSIEPDRIVYTPLNNDNAYNALILGYKQPGNAGGGIPVIPETGDRSALSLYAALLLASAGAFILMRKRTAK